MNETAILIEPYSGSKRKILFNTCTGWIAVALLFFIPTSTTGTSVLSALYIILLLISGKLKEVLQFFKSPITLALLCFVLISFIGIYYSSAPINDIYVAIKKSVRLLLFPFLLPVFKEPIWQKRGLFALLGGIFLLVLWGFYHSVSFGTDDSIKDRIYTSSFVAFECFCLILFIGERNISRLAKIILCIILGCSLIYLMLISSGRMGQMMLFMLFCFLFVRSFARKMLKGFKVILSLLIVLSLIDYATFNIFFHQKNEAFANYQATILNLPAFARYQELYNSCKTYIQDWKTQKDGNATPPLGIEESTIRLEFYARTLHLCLKKPFVGYGTGSFKSVYNAEYPERMQNGYSVNNPHNQYLLSFFEYGIFGILSLLFIFYSVWKKAYLLSNRFEANLLFGTLFFMMLGCLFNSWLLDFTSSYFFICTIALISARSIYEERGKGVSVSS